MASNLRTGDVLEYQGEPHRVLHAKTGAGRVYAVIAAGEDPVSSLTNRNVTGIRLRLDDPVRILTRPR